jgi:hypothetical protein
MKMENVLRAERDGTVQTIQAKEGDSLAEADDPRGGAAPGHGGPVHVGAVGEVQRHGRTGRPYASVERWPSGTVWGVLWDLALSDVPALDRYEGVMTREAGQRRAMAARSMLEP